VAEVAAEVVAGEARTQAGADRLKGRLRGGPAQALFQAFTARLAQAHAKEGQEQHRVCELEDQLSSQRRTLEELRHAAQRRDLAHDSERTQAEREHARKVQLLLHQITHMQDQINEQGGTEGAGGDGGEGSGGAGILSLPRPAPQSSQGVAQGSGDLRNMLMLKEEQIQALDKDNLYYKQANRELKRRMRDLLNTTTDQPLSPGNLSAREAELVRANKQLQIEVQNCRAFMSHTGASVRVSKRGVREVGSVSVSRDGTPVQKLREVAPPAMAERISVGSAVEVGSVNMSESEWRISSRDPRSSEPNTEMSTMSLYDSLDGTKK